MGKTDEWRINRMGVFATGNWKPGTTPKMIYGLPYDEDDTQPEDDDWITTFYNNATK